MASNCTPVPDQAMLDALAESIFLGVDETESNGRRTKFMTAEKRLALLEMGAQMRCGQRVSRVGQMEFCADWR